MSDTEGARLLVENHQIIYWQKPCPICGAKPDRSHAPFLRCSDSSCGLGTISTLGIGPETWVKLLEMRMIQVRFLGALREISSRPCERENRNDTVSIPSCQKTGFGFHRGRWCAPCLAQEALGK